MTNKFKYFIGNWKMYGNLSSFKIIQNIEKYIKKSQHHIAIGDHEDLKKDLEKEHR